MPLPSTRPRRKNKHNNYMSSNTTGLPQVCVLTVSFLCVAYGIYSVVESYGYTRETVEANYLEHLKNWTRAQEEFANSKFFMSYSVIGGKEDNITTSEFLMTLDKTPDRFSAIVQAEHLPSYSNAMYLKKRVEPATLIDKALVWPDLTIPDHHGGQRVGPGSLSLSIRGVYGTSRPASSFPTILIDGGELGRRRTVHAKTPAPERKCPQVQLGIYNKATGKCDIYSRLSIICVQMKLDYEKGEWELHEMEAGGAGCSGSDEWGIST